MERGETSQSISKPEVTFDSVVCLLIFCQLFLRWPRGRALENIR